MGFLRPTVMDQGMQRPARAGDLSAVSPQVTVQAADSNQNISVDAIAGGVYARAGMTAGRTDTLPTAAALLAADAFRFMDIGDSFVFAISVRVAFALTLTMGTGITAVNAASVPASSARWFVLVRTGAATFDLIGL